MKLIKKDFLSEGDWNILVKYNLLAHISYYLSTGTGLDTIKILLGSATDFQLISISKELGNIDPSGWIPRIIRYRRIVLAYNDTLKSRNISIRVSTKIFSAFVIHFSLIIALALLITITVILFVFQQYVVASIFLVGKLLTLLYIIYSGPWESLKTLKYYLRKYRNSDLDFDILLEKGVIVYDSL